MATLSKLAALIILRSQIDIQIQRLHTGEPGSARWVMEEDHYLEAMKRAEGVVQAGVETMLSPDPSSTEVALQTALDLLVNPLGQGEDDDKEVELTAEHRQAEIDASVEGQLQAKVLLAIQQTLTGRGNSEFTTSEIRKMTGIGLVRLMRVLLYFNRTHKIEKVSHIQRNTIWRLV